MTEPSNIFSSEDEAKRKGVLQKWQKLTCEISERDVAESHCACVWRVCLLPVLIEIHAIQTGFRPKVLPCDVCHIPRASRIGLDEADLARCDDGNVSCMLLPVRFCLDFVRG